MTQSHTLIPGDRIVLIYPSVGASRHFGTVTQVTPISISVDIDGLLRPKQFFFTHKRRWRSELGHMVSVGRLSLESSRPAAGADALHASTHSVVRSCRSAAPV